MTQIDLAQLTQNGEVRNLAGHERGRDARTLFKLDQLDGLEGRVVIVVPDELYLLSPSFIQGMFANSITKLGSREEFLKHYGFQASLDVLKQIENGIEASLMKRRSFMN